MKHILTWLPLLAVSLAALAAAGCSGDEADRCDGPDPVVESIGTGDLERGMLPLAPGDALTVHLAFNGAHTVMVSARFQGVVLDAKTLDLDVALRLDGTVIGGTTGPVHATASGGEVEVLGIRARITHALGSTEGRTVNVAVAATDACGRLASSSVDTRLVW